MAGKEEPWLIGPDCPLHYCLQLYYTKHPEKNVQVVLRKSQITNEDDVEVSNSNTDNEKTPKKRKARSSTNNKKDPPISTETKRTRGDTSTDTLSACGGCGLPVGPVHKCDMCQRNMHPFCGRTIGEEGHGSMVRCKKCDCKK